MKTTTDMSKFLTEQFKVNTGINMLDSGGDSGRRWQRNADKTTADFDNEPEVAPIDEWDLNNATDTSDITPTVSTYHYMMNNLELDELCDEFNAIPCDNWDSELAYGVSAEGEQFLRSKGYTVNNTWNSYNYESSLDYVLQGANVVPQDDNETCYPEYLLIQVHLGADVRGGYTDAKLYRVATEYFDTNPTVYGTIDGVDVSTGYNGYNLTDDYGNAVPIHKDSDIELSVAE